MRPSSRDHHERIPVVTSPDVPNYRAKSRTRGTAIKAISSSEPRINPARALNRPGFGAASFFVKDEG